MEIKHADFVASFPSESACPRERRAEFAFIGRSNVGKSSLINMLTSRRSLAKVSGTPGKTRLLNFFLINKFWHLVDLPGYGYARVSKSEQQVLAKLINDYLLNREQMLVAFVLIDATINPPSKVDLAFIDHLGENQVPFALIFTKTDRLKPGAVQNSIQAFSNEMLKTWSEMPKYFISSSQTRAGRTDILEYIESLLNVKPG